MSLATKARCDTLLLQLGPGHHQSILHFAFTFARSFLAAREPRYLRDIIVTWIVKWVRSTQQPLPLVNLSFVFRQISLSFVGATEANIADISYRLATTDRQISRYVDVLVPPVKNKLLDR